MSIRQRQAHEDAETRQTRRAGRSASQQWLELDARLGIHVGAKKERTRLAKLINDPSHQA